MRDSLMRYKDWGDNYKRETNNPAQAVNTRV